MKIAFAAAWILGMLAIYPAAAQQEKMINEQEALELASDAYIYGFPLVAMDIAREIMTNTLEPHNGHAPLNQFFHERKVSIAGEKALFSYAWLDLSKQPYILHVPSSPHRSILFPLISAWTELFTTLGSSGTLEGEDYAITGPGWSGQLPKKVKECRAPTNLVWVQGRIQCSGTQEDYVKAHAVQDQCKLTPISAYGKTYHPPQGTFSSQIDMKTPLPEQVEHLKGKTFFMRLAQLMKDNPPPIADGMIVANLARIGVIPGKDFNISSLDVNIQKGIQGGPQLAIEKLNVYGANKAKSNTYSIDYLKRAYDVVKAFGGSTGNFQVSQLSVRNNE